MHGPIRVITVEREYGSRGGEFAHDLAARLGWRLLDEELVKNAAKTAGVTPERAMDLDERLDPWYYRYGKIFWQESAYPIGVSGESVVFDSDRLMALIDEEVKQAARVGNCVIVGRGSACALAGEPGCFHVFVYATARAKREWFIRAFPDKAQHAEHHLAVFDKRRAAVIRKFYGQEWCARGLYHMLLNSCIGTNAMMTAVEGATGLVPVQAIAAD